VVDKPEKPKPKKGKKAMPTATKVAQFLQRSVVRGKIVNTDYFKEQGLKVFLGKLQAQGWLDLFTNTQRGCSVPNLAEFYANCEVTKGVVTSKVDGKKLRFNANELGKILGIPFEGLGVYVREDKTTLGAERLLQLTQRLNQQPDLKTPRSVKKGEMTPLHRLLFWFVIKNIIPPGQGRNLADAMDLCPANLLDREERISLPAIMISHMSRIANTAREHDLVYGFLLTSVFEHFGVSLHKKVGVQVTDEIRCSTLLSCEFKITKNGTTGSEQGPQTPFTPVPGPSSSGPSLDTLL